MDKTDYETTTQIVNGYWYTFEYKPPKMVAGYDRYPFIYCIGPCEFNINCFEGLNLHQMPLGARMEFMTEFDRVSHFRDSDERKVYTREFIINGIYQNCQNAIRIYNRKNVWNPIRILNKSVPWYITYDGDIMFKKPDYVMNKYLLDSGKNNTTEARR